MDEDLTRRADLVSQLSPTLIIGTGLIGASIGCALTKAGVEVFLSDVDHSNAVIAASRGAGTVATPRPSVVKLVVVAVPPKHIPDVVVAKLPEYPGAVITDVGSVKSVIEAEITDRSPDAGRYVGSHPMGGSQYTGPITAVPELFVDRTWVIAARPDNPPWATDRVGALAELCQARITYLSATEHDRAVAEVSHLPQVMSALTGARLQAAPRSDLALAGQGVRDVTRIAGSDPRLWNQIIAGNRVQVLKQLQGVQADLAAFIDMLSDEHLDHLNHPEVIGELLERGRAGVKALPGKHGRRPEELKTVVVEIPDTPGALARLFSNITDEGINIEDLSIDHDPIKDVGFLAVQVDPEREAQLRSVLRDDGWTLRA